MKHNYNIMALRGANITDEEYVESFGVNPEYAHTPNMLEWHVKDMIESNRSLYESQGMVEGEIKMKLKEQESRVRSDYKKLLAQNGLL